MARCFPSSVPLMSCVFPAEGPADRLGLQEREDTRERVGPHVPHGHDVPDHH